MLTSAVEHYARQQRITAAALAALRRERNRGPLALAQILAAFQILAARDAAASVPLMLEEQGIDAPPVADVVVSSVAGVASDGRPLETLVDYGQEQSPGWFNLMAATQIQDAARAASSLAIASRPNVSGWVRMMNPPSCSRCAVLAGKFFRWNQGFERHPRCDCRHIPSQEADYSDVRLSGDKWFHTLPEAEQDRIFTKAGAAAVRDGADLGQVVNARRGMAKAQIGSGSAFITREGVTRRGLYGSSDAGKAQGYMRTDVGRRGAVANYGVRTSKRPRIMPETIYEVAPDRAEAIRLLKRNGFIL